MFNVRREQQNAGSAHAGFHRLAASANLFLSGIKRRRAGTSKFRVPGIR
jgi:hypothetical protein